MAPTPEPGPWVDRLFPDLLLHARMRVVNSAVVGYEVRTLSIYEEGEPLCFHCMEDNHSDVTPDVEKAEILVQGTIKFDGCSHNDFGDGGYIHGCQREHMTRLGTMFDRLFDWAIKLIGDDGEYLKRGNL